MEKTGNPTGPVDRNHLDLISRIYDLPLHPERWQAVLDEFAPVMNADMAGISVQDPVYAEHQLTVITSNMPPSFIDQYHSRFSGQGTSPFVKMVMNPKREFQTELELMELENAEKYAERPAAQWLKQNFNLFHGAASCLNLDGAWTNILLVMRPESRGPVTDQDKMIGNSFLDHFAKSMELGRAFGVLKSRFDGVLTALDRFHIGIFLLSPNGAVVVKNAEADRILDADDGLTLSREGRMVAADEGQRGALKDAITQAARTAQAQQNRAETLLALPRRSGADPYLVEVSPLRDDGEIDGPFRGCLVFVIDPAKTDVVSTEGMQALYGLTNSESEVCRLLAEGLETDDVAEARNITRETVRNYIKQVLQKTGVNNRSQLVRLALNINLPIDPT